MNVYQYAMVFIKIALECLSLNLLLLSFTNIHYILTILIWAQVYNYESYKHAMSLDMIILMYGTGMP